jgi:hypothetical protein
MCRGQDRCRRGHDGEAALTVDDHSACRNCARRVAQEMGTLGNGALRAMILHTNDVLDRPECLFHDWVLQGEGTIHAARGDQPTSSHLPRD